MGEVRLEVVYTTDENVTQITVDDVARSVACRLYQMGGERFTVHHEGRPLLFDARDSSRWTRSSPAPWGSRPRKKTAKKKS